MISAAQSPWPRRREWLWTALIAVTVSWCSGQPAVAIESGWLEFDKVAHFAIYGALATAIIRCRELRDRRWLGIVGAILLASGYGLADEFRQSLTHGVRTFDLHDWAADTAGAITAAFLYGCWPAYRKLYEMPLRRARPPAAIPAVSTPISAP